MEMLRCGDWEPYFCFVLSACNPCIGFGTGGTPPGTAPNKHETPVNIGLARRYGRYGQKTPLAGKGVEHAQTRTFTLRFPLFARVSVKNCTIALSG